MVQGSLHQQMRFAVSGSGSRLRVQVSRFRVHGLGLTVSDGG